MADNGALPHPQTSHPHGAFFSGHRFPFFFWSTSNRRRLPYDRRRLHDHRRRLPSNRRRITSNRRWLPFKCRPTQRGAYLDARQSIPLFLELAQRDGVYIKG